MSRLAAILAVNIVINICSSQLMITNATNENATHQYFDTSSILNYASDIIICSTSYCHIICDEVSGCYSTSIDASLSDTLIIECSKPSACDHFSITNGPQKDLFISCTDLNACYYGSINALTTTSNINLYCDEISTTSYSNAPCSYLDLNVSAASDVSIQCVTQQSCFKTEVYTKYMDGIFNLNCTDNGACAQFELYASDMAIGSTVNIYCDGDGSGQYACSGQYYCPLQGICNLNCLTTQACAASMRVATEEYQGLNLNCDSPTNDACIATSIYCIDTSSSSPLSYDSSNSRWICTDFDCCTFFAGDQQNCAEGSDCTLLCNTGMNCRNAILNGSLATSLTVDCAGTKCEGAKILCPTGDNTACSINCYRYCNDVIIEGGNGNHMNSFNLHCDWFTSSGCFRAKISLNSASITTAIINSTTSYNVDYNTYFEFLAPNTIISDLYVECWGRETCDHSTFITQISGSAIFNCNGWISCSSSDITLTSTASDVNYIINCNNSPDDPYTSYGACYGTYWYIHGYVDSMNYIETNNNITIECDSHSCLYAHFYAYNLNHADVDCKINGQWACRESVMYFESTNSLNLKCMGNLGCQEAEIHCPWSGPNVCKIICSQSTETCKSLEVLVPDSYVFGYLDLNCASETSYPDSDACNGLFTDCNQGRPYYTPTPTPTKWDDTGYYVWDSIANDYQCSNTGARYCCPYYNATQDEVGLCQAGMDCIVDCSVTSCGTKIIDGFAANYLNVTCGASECQYTVFLCPPGGCNIFCNSTRACEYATFGYGGLTVPNAKVKVVCYGYYACSKTVMDMKYVNELDLTCQGRVGQFDRTCYGMNFQADYANKVQITAIERGAIDRNSAETWYARYAKEVIINGQGYNAIGSIYFYAQYAGSMELNLVSDLNWKYPIDGTTFYVPDNTTLNCYGYGCREIYSLYGNNIFSGLQINIDTCEVCDSIGDCIDDLRLHCSAGADYWNYGNLCAGDSTPNTCGCLDVVNKIQFYTNYEEQKCATPRIIETCSSGSSCIYNCDSANLNCKDLVIDGRAATELTVNCGDSNYCENTVIYCQNSGSCTISCSASNACTTAKILYDGQLSDNGMITINCQVSNACDSMEWNVQNAESVTINADVSDSAISSILRADYVGSLVINLKNAATNTMTWYIPQNTTFNCYGTGCSNLNEINRVDINTAVGFEINIASCGQCSSVEDCLYYFDLNCPNGIDSFTSNDPCSNSNICGCKDIINFSRTQLTNNYGDLSQCNNNLAVHSPTCKSNKECVVDCTSVSCENEIIDGRPGTSLIVNCGGNSNYCKNTFIHCGSTGSCHVICNVNNVCLDTKLFYDGSTESVNLECSTELSCNNMIINTKNAVSFNVSLTSDGGNGATSGTQWFIPQNTIFICYGTGCKNLNEINRGNIITSIGLSFNINTCNECDTLTECLNDFNLNCISGQDLYRSIGLCSDATMDNQCGCTDIVNNNIQFTTTYSGNNCPGIAPIISYCTAGIECKYKCDNKTGINCEGQVIVGGDASYLTVDCGDSYHCRNTTIDCPLAGCDINCNNTYSCDFMKVLYNGKTSDIGTININCLGRKACNKINIKTDYVYQINLICQGIASLSNYACERIKLHANHAEMVSIAVSEQYGSYYDEWNVQYANNIIIDAKGSGSYQYALYRSKLYANYAESVEINLISDTDTSHPSNYMDWYVPRNTSFNCFGYGCYKLYEIYRGDINTSIGFYFNIETCGKCNNIGDCMDNFDINCGINGQYDGYRGSSLCSNYNDCGCRDILQIHTNIASTYNEPKCYTPYTPDPTAITSPPTTAQPTTKNPTAMPSISPITKEPTTAIPTTQNPTTYNPTTHNPTTYDPTTHNPTTLNPTTLNPTTLNPTTVNQTTVNPTTSIPTTATPTSQDPTTSKPTTAMPTTAIPTITPITAEPSNPPITAQPSGSPTTSEPSVSPITFDPSISPITLNPTTVQPTDNLISSRPTTLDPTTLDPTTSNPTTSVPTTSNPTTSDLTTIQPSTSMPTTSNPTISEEPSTASTKNVLVTANVSNSSAAQPTEDIVDGVSMMDYYVSTISILLILFIVNV